MNHVTVACAAPLDVLAKELGDLSVLAEERIRNYSLREQADMRTGLPRDGASAEETKTREMFARINELSVLLNTHHH